VVTLMISALEWFAAVLAGWVMLSLIVFMAVGIWTLNKENDGKES